MGKARNAASPTGRSALRERLSLWRHLSRPRRRGRPRVALRRHRGDAASPRGNLPPRRRGRPRRPIARPRRMAHNRQARPPPQHHADLPAFPRAGAEPVENVWQFLRGNWLSNLVFETYDDIIDAACDAWRKLIAQPEIITSIGMRDWHHIGQTP